MLREGIRCARLPFVRHLPVSQIRHKYRACRHPVEKTRWHALWLLARTDEPRTPAQVADLVGLSAVTVRAVLHRWNDRRPGRAGRPAARATGPTPKLTARRRDALYAALQKRPPDGGLWTGPKVARYVRDRWGVDGRPGDRVAVAAGPRVHPPGAPPEPPEGGRPRRPAGGGKKLAAAGEAAAGGATPGKAVEVWAEDEARLGLKPITRRVWWLKGCRPTVVRADQVRVAVRVRVRPPGDRRDVHRHPAAGERRADGRRPGRVRRPRRPGRGEGAGGGGGQRRVAHGQAAGGPGRTSGCTSSRRAPRSCSRSSRSGRWSGRRWRTTRSTGWPTSGGWSAAGAGGWPRTGRPSWGPSGSTGRSTWKA